MAGKMLPLLMLILSAAFTLVSCTASQVSYDPLDPPEDKIKVTAAPSDWLTVEEEPSMHYIKTENINAGKTPVIKIDLPVEQLESFIMPIKDGGCLAVSQKPVDETDKSSYPQYYLHAMCYTANGSIKWDRIYYKSPLPYRGYLISMCVFDNGGFALSLRVLKAWDGISPYISDVYNDKLCKFSPDGSLIWELYDESYYLPGMLDYLYATEDGSIIAAGTITGKANDNNTDASDPSDSTADPSDSSADNSKNIYISLARFNDKGYAVNYLNIKETDYCSLISVSHSDATGLVISYETDPARLLQPEGSSIQMLESRVICYSNELEEKWSLKMLPTCRIHKIEQVPETEAALAIGVSMTAAGSEPSAFFINNHGIVEWNYPAGTGNKWLQTAVRLMDGRFVCGSFRISDERREITSFDVLTNEGIHEATLETIPGVIRKIIPTADGGFTAVLQNSVRALPQPPYVSSIWTDTEAILFHYDSGLKLVWQRKVDQYKYDRRTDIIIPAVDGIIFAG